MDVKMMDAESGDSNKEVQNLGERKSLKRSFNDIHTAGEEVGDSGEETKDSNEETEDSSDEDDDHMRIICRNKIFDGSDEDYFRLVHKSKIPTTPIHNLYGYEGEMFDRLGCSLKEEDPLVETCRNILEILRKKDTTSADADQFSKMVKQVLQDDRVVNWMEEESKNSYCFGYVTCASEDTEKWLTRSQENIEGLIARIKSDRFFGRASASEYRVMVVRGVLGILLGYCVTPAYLLQIARVKYYFAKSYKPQSFMFI